MPWILLLAGVLGLVIWGVGSSQSSLPLSAPAPSVPPVLWESLGWIATLLAMGLLLFLGVVAVVRWWKTPVIPVAAAPAGRSWVPNLRLTKDGTGTIIFLSLAVFAVFNWIAYSALGPVPLYSTAEGWGHLLMYVLLITLASWVTAYIVALWWKRFILLAVIVVCFAWIGPRTGMLLDPDGKLSARFAALWGKIPPMQNLLPGATASAPRTGDGTCDGTIRAIELSNKPQLINGGARCEMDWMRYESVTLLVGKTPHVFPPGEGGGVGLKPDRWQCTTGSSCLVMAHFCPSKQRWNDALQRCS